MKAIAHSTNLYISARWRDPKNAYRVNWSINNVPTLVRYQRVDGVISETGRLVEGQILNKDRLRGFISTERQRKDSCGF